MRLGRMLRRLDGDEGGQMSLLGVLGATALACLLLWVVNTGYATNRKIKLQNAADASALSAGVMVARALNVIAMNNVTQTQLLAVALIVPSLQKAIPLALKTLAAQAVLCPPCAKALALEAGFIGQVLAPAVAYASAAVPLLWAAMSALSYVSLSVALATPPLTLATTETIAEQNAGAIGLALPLVGAGPPFPVTRGTTADLCGPARDGSASTRPRSRGYELLLGYPPGKGPLRDYAEKVTWALVIPTFSSNLVWNPLGVFTGNHDGHFQNMLNLEYRMTCTTRPVPFPMLVGARGMSEANTRLQLRYLSVLYESRRDGGIAWGSNLFKSPWGGHRLAYAQSKVYNATSFDSFTQDWRAKLMPADRLDDGTALTVPWASPRTGVTLPRSEALKEAARFGQRARLLNH